MIREAGAFGRVEVYWEVLNPSDDISDTSGRLTFLEEQRTATLVLTAQPDDIPEPAEIYNVELRSVSGGGRLAATTLATVTILQNDDPIRFNGSFAQVEEGDIATFTVIREGQANGK